MLTGVGFAHHIRAALREAIMKMIKTLLLSATAAVVLSPAALAQQHYQSQADCEADRQGRQVAGAIFGAILGGVVGAQIENSIDDRDEYRGRHYRGGRGYGRGRHGRYRRHYENRNENDVAVAAGAGLGALVGAGVAGGDPCAPDYRHDNGYYGDDRYRDDRYSNNDYRYNDDYRDAGYSDGAYRSREEYEASRNRETHSYGSEGLAGAPRSDTARVYQAVAPATNDCRWMQTRRQDGYGNITVNDVYMCRGTDGVWRPAQ